MKKSVFKFLVFIISIFISNITINAYQVGDVIKYEGNKYYVISDINDKVTMLKFDPLTTKEVNYYGKEHVNYYSKFEYNDNSNLFYEKEAVDISGYGGVAFFQNENCKIYDAHITEGCNNSYEDSEIKYVVDEWGKDNTVSEDLTLDSTGYSVRLLTLDELIIFFSFENRRINDSSLNMEYIKTNNTPFWVYKYNYWLMTPSDDSNGVFTVDKSRGSLKSTQSLYYSLVRPVITLSKSKLNSKNSAKTYVVNNEKYEITYGNNYNVGDSIIYNGIRFTIIKDSNDSDDSIVLIKDEPLKYDEVIINIPENLKITVNKLNERAILEYYSSDTCNRVDKTGCTNKYEKSNLKYILDKWVFNNLKIDNIDITSLNARIITKTDLEDNFGYTLDKANSQGGGGTSGDNLYYSPPNYTEFDLSYCFTDYAPFDSNYQVLHANGENKFTVRDVNYPGAICPIITLNKKKLNTNNIVVNIPNTKLYKNIIIVICGFILFITSIILIIAYKRKQKSV